VAEVYVGTKFRTRFASRELSRDPRLAELVEACRRLAEAGLAPGGAGNASMRSPGGFLVTPTAADLGAIGTADFVEVLGCDVGRAELLVRGAREPSSESMVHAGVYDARPDVGAILHGHSDELLGRAGELGLPLTARERPYGTSELVLEVLAALAGHSFLLIRGHGFLSLGAGPAEAWRGAEEVLARLRGGFPT
jgi:L-fuculose-phosphate aldolase